MKHDEKFILGVDPGSVSVGYALILASSQKFRIIKAGTLKLSSKDEFFNRIGEIAKFFNKFSKEHEAFELALESLIHVKNVSSLTKLSQARGAVIASVSTKVLTVHEYAPNLIKSTVSGYGLSSKASVEKSLNFVFPEHKFSSHDESDALAIALCHSFQGGAAAKGLGGKVSSRGKSLKDSFKHLLK